MQTKDWEIALNSIVPDSAQIALANQHTIIALILALRQHNPEVTAEITSTLSGFEATNSSTIGKVYEDVISGYLQMLRHGQPPSLTVV